MSREPFTAHQGIAVPLRRSSVDTDQMISAKFLKRISRDGYEDALFASWREDPAFVLNREPYRRGSVLVAGTDFGVGSSREQAVWALQNYGFRVIISSRFGDIFRTNSGKAGLLTARVAQPEVDRLWTTIEADPGMELLIDLRTRTIVSDRHDLLIPFEFPEHTRIRLLRGMDEIASTLQHEDEIRSFESARSALKPVVPAVGG